MKFIQRDPYYAISQDPAGFIIAKVFVSSEVKYIVSRNKKTLGVPTNFRSALKCCIDDLVDELSISINELDIMDVSSGFKSSTNSSDQMLFNKKGR